MTDSGTDTRVNDMSIRVQIGTIFTDVQAMKTDLAVIKSSGDAKRIDDLETIAENRNKEITDLRDKISEIQGRLNVLWVFFGIATTIVTAFILKGLNL